MTYKWLLDHFTRVFVLENAACNHAPFRGVSLKQCNTAVYPSCLWARGNFSDHYFLPSISSTQSPRIALIKSFAIHCGKLLFLLEWTRFRISYIFDDDFFYSRRFNFSFNLRLHIKNILLI